ncbi:MAG: ABC transporter permease [Hyphomicrobiaceae bacterium]
MARDLLLLEMALKAVSGALLLFFPRSLARILGLPPVGETFWPRLLGALLIGLGAATFLEGQLATRNGLGLAGQVAINFAAALALTGVLIMGQAGTTRRGRALVALAATGLSVLALLELAWV